MKHLHVYFISYVGHGASSGCGWRRWPLDMKASCEYIG